MKSIYKTYILLLLFFLVPWRESYSQAVSLTYPNGGEVIHAATTIDIEWNYLNIDNLLIEYSTDGGFEWHTVISSIPSSALKYAWKVPPTPSEKCLVRLTDILGGAQDESDAFFTIPVPTIEWVYPHEEGIVFYTGTVEGLEWATPDVDDVKIEYSTDNGTNWTTITESMDGFWRYYNWVVPDVTTSEGLFRITSVFNNEIFDVAEHNFSIQPLAVSAAAKYHGGSYDGHAKRSTNQDYITLTHPVGGETWTTNSTRSISWNFENVEDISIDISYDNGQSWSNLISSYPASAKSYDWVVAGQTSEECKIRVTDIRTGVEDISPEVFTIPPPVLTITYPQDGDVLMAQTIEGLEWIGDDITTVRIEYSLDGGETWLSITNSVAGNWNYFNWVIPNVEQDNVLLKITDLDNEANSDVLTTGFSIMPLTLSTPAKYKGGSYDGYTVRNSLADSVQILSPNGGEIFLSSQTYPIEWTYNNVDNFKIEFSYDNGNSWSVVTPSVPASALKYNWVVPSQPSQYCKIRLTCLDNNEVTDESDAVFTIPYPMVNIIYPVPGVTLENGTIESIEWESPASETVKIEFSDDGGETWGVVNESVNGHWGYYNWVVPDSISSQCMLRITDNQNEDFTAQSQGVFAIKELTPTTPAKFRGGSYDGYALNIFLDQHLLVRKPNGWEAYLANEPIPIRWTHLNIDGTMRVDVTQDNEQTWQTLASGIPVEQGNYTWAGGREASSWNKIRVVHETGLWQDKSDNFFIVGEMGELYTEEIADIHYCAGQQIEIPFSTNESYGPENIFIAQLSGPDGTFSNQSDSLGMLAGTVSGTIQALIPDSIAGSTSYRIRVVSTDPPIIGIDNGTDIPINALPQIDLGEDTILCEGNTLTLDPGFDESHAVTWSTGVSTPTLEVTNGGIYYVDVSNACGLATDTIQVVYRELPNNNLPEQLVVCENSSVVLNALDSEAVTYQWNTGRVTPSITANSPGTYTVTLANACGSVDYSVLVEEVANPVFDLGETLAICGDEEITLSAPAGYSSYEWNTGENQSQISVANAGYYEVTVTDANGCIGSDNVSVQKHDVLPVFITGETQINMNETTELTASEGFMEYVWSDDQTGQTIIVSDAGTYTVEAFDINGCSATASVNVSVNESETQQLLTVSIIGNGSVDVNDAIYTEPIWLAFGSQPTLNAIADAGWLFMEWSGSIASETVTETLEMTAAMDVTAEFARLGDVNKDQSINIIDVTMMVSHILENNPPGFYVKLADVTQDQSINIIDVVADVNIILYDAIIPPGKMMASQMAHIHAPDNGIIQLESDGTLAAIEFEMLLNSEETIEPELMAEGFHLAFSQKGNRIKGLIFNTANHTFAEGMIPLLNIGSEAAFSSWGKLIGSNTFAQSVDIEPAVVSSVLQENERLFTARLFPNPSAGVFFLELNMQETATAEISLFDANGKQVSSQQPMQLEAGMHNIEMGSPNLSTGLYVVRLKITNSQGLTNHVFKIMID